MTTKLTIAAATILSAAVTAFAGWEDTGAVRAPSPAPQQRPATAAKPAAQRRQPTAAPQRTAPAESYDTPVAPRGSASQMPPDLYSAFLDTSAESDAWYRLSVESSGDVEGSDDGFGLIVADAHFNLGLARDLLYGDLSVNLDPSISLLTDDAAITYMPSVLLAIPFDFSWVWRYLNGWSFELGARPGIYADAKGLFQTKALSVPFRGCFYYAIDQETAVRFGAEIRPGWDLIAMPLLGLAWQPSEMFFTEIGLPRSIAEVQLGPVGIYGKIAWNNMTYALDGSDEDPDSFTLNGWQFGAGVSVAFTETIRLAFEAGVITGREITFDGGADDADLDVDSATYFSVLFGSEF